jgi:tRNA G10  N-methylase Trm11
MGLGTTYMVANSLWYNVIGSDINITPAKQNLAWWKAQEFAKDLPITLFAYDATQSLSKPFLHHVNCIVTEGWLGRIVTWKTTDNDIELFAQEVEILYTGRIDKAYEFYKTMTIVCSIPWYTGANNVHVENILMHCEDKGISVSEIKQVYTRAGQNVGRKIVTLQR